MLLNFGFSQIVCSSSWERGRSSSHSSTSTTTPPCESTFLYPTGSWCIWQKTTKKEIFTQVSTVVDRRQICGRRLQLSGDFTTMPWSLIISSCHDDWSSANHVKYNLTWSGCFLQLLCPCDHVLLLRSFHSGGERQVLMSFGWRSWRWNLGRWYEWYEWHQYEM